MEETVRNIYKKLPVILLFIFVLFLVAFCTWQLFQGNLEAAFSTLPFLLIIYLFVIRRRS
jgi:F0F1-type ATP synthase assembly protein I